MFVVTVGLKFGLVGLPSKPALLAYGRPKRLGVEGPKNGDLGRYR